MPQEECKGGDCPLRPQFDEPNESEGKASGASDKKVRLSTSKYVQLLIDARETDPDCWPPGLEEAAGMIESARVIEEECIKKWGEFDPDKLSREQGRRYFEIHLALDALQEESADQPLDLQSALSQARHTLDADEAGEQDTPPAPASPSAPASTPTSEGSGHTLPSAPAPGLSEGFFAQSLPISQPEEFFIAQAGPHQAKSEEYDAFFLDGGWPEMPPLQRGDNYA